MKRRAQRDRGAPQAASSQTREPEYIPSPRECQIFYNLLPPVGVFTSLEALSGRTGFTEYCPERVLAIAKYCACAHRHIGDSYIEIIYNVGRDRNVTLIRQVSARIAAQETDEATDALTEALQDLRAKKGGHHE